MVQIDIGLTSRGEEVESSSAVLHSGSRYYRGECLAGGQVSPQL